MIDSETYNKECDEIRDKIINGEISLEDAEIAIDSITKRFFDKITNEEIESILIESGFYNDGDD